MSTPREVAEKFFNYMANGDFVQAFGMLRDDAPYRVIGNTPLSGVYNGPADLMAKLGPALSELKDLKVTLAELIVEGNRAVALMRGTAQAPHGPYVQDPAIFIVTIDGEKIAGLLEMVDTVMIETRCFGKQLVDPAA